MSTFHKEAKKEYDLLLKTGELLEAFPFLTGEWQKDKEEFIESYLLNLDIINLEAINQELDDEDDY